MAGTACGFHHTQVDPGLTCMGLDPWTQGCPSGWDRKYQFDDSSGSGYWAWCEYKDPSGLCAYPNTTNCQTAAAEQGFAMSLTSNTDATGVADVGSCPVGWSRSPYFDMGRSSGQGLSYCAP
jgi:hypothetical protein